MPKKCCPCLRSSSSRSSSKSSSRSLPNTLGEPIKRTTTTPTKAWIEMNEKRIKGNNNKHWKKFMEKSVRSALPELPYDMQQLIYNIITKGSKSSHMGGSRKHQKKGKKSRKYVKKSRKYVKKSGKCVKKSKRNAPNRRNKKQTRKRHSKKI